MAEGPLPEGGRAPARRRGARQRLADLLLTREPRQRTRLLQVAFALVLMSTGILTMHLGAALGIVDRGPLALWSVLSATGFVAVAVMIRTGANLRYADPSLTLLQMVHGTAFAAWAYALAGTAHATAPFVMALILMFGMFGMDSRQVVWVAAYAIGLFGLVMRWCSLHDPVRYPPGADLMLFIVMVTVVVGIVVLTMRLHHMRDRLKGQKRALSAAFDEIQRLATHDDLTGLVNRRHLQGLLDAERLRHQRDRHPWCVALIDLDHFKRINDAHGHATGDEVLRRMGERAAGLIRRTDVLGRWGGEEFVLSLPGADLATAHRSLDRLRAHFHEHPLAVDGTTLSISFSAGVTQHRFGETVAQTLERADRLAYRAKERGRNRVEAG